MNAPIPVSSFPLEVLLAECTVRAGFTSPAADHAQKRIDLTKELVLHEDATFVINVAGDSMVNIGIVEGDFVLVDKAIQAEHGMIVLAVVDGEFTLKRLYKVGKVVRLMAENDAYPPMDFVEGQEMSIWGVVTNSFRRHYVTRKQKRHVKAAA